MLAQEECLQGKQRYRTDSLLLCFEWSREVLEKKIYGEGWLCQVLEDINFQAQVIRLSCRHKVLVAVSRQRHYFRRISLVMVSGLVWRRKVLERGRLFEANAITYT